MSHSPTSWLEFAFPTTHCKVHNRSQEGLGCLTGPLIHNSNVDQSRPRTTKRVRNQYGMEASTYLPLRSTCRPLRDTGHPTLQVENNSIQGPRSHLFWSLPPYQMALIHVGHHCLEISNMYCSTTTEQCQTADEDWFGGKLQRKPVSG